ncbi:GlsB/YeaQ/YmgE family stress response membrane protein [uncultured Oxalicibacterium sp.]|uniref:GlsB/YeaQ/YmgE family stress response membrane protein n=1 Tax=uncultured Oxalicibacterium sp. TaxID=1168540 RepID=UPI0026014349|nr:GlsB/YeaQ/YmgE family stress response membrane protein [uncultured Oxalicibacterium sp.]
MPLILCIATGLALGAMLAVPTAHSRADVTLNLLTGMSGAVLGGWLLGPVFEPQGVVAAFDETNMISAVGGALILLAIVHVLHTQDAAD